MRRHVASPRFHSILCSQGPGQKLPGENPPGRNAEKPVSRKGREGNDRSAYRKSAAVIPVDPELDLRQDSTRIGESKALVRPLEDLPFRNDGGKPRIQGAEFCL